MKEKMTLHALIASVVIVYLAGTLFSGDYVQALVSGIQSFFRANSDNTGMARLLYIGGLITSVANLGFSIYLWKYHQNQRKLTQKAP
ncbi:hypothetical protein JXL21_07295 [Candidatus Bathyarchaeota archaeon]|nr:hypothetical protein [Candidatus Bathyarchaeota archaeon]